MKSRFIVDSFNDPRISYNFHIFPTSPLESGDFPWSFRGNQRRHAPLPLWRALQVWTRRCAWSSARRSKDGTSATCSLTKEQRCSVQNPIVDVGWGYNQDGVVQYNLHVMLQYLFFCKFFSCIHDIPCFSVSPMPSWSDYPTDFSFAVKILAHDVSTNLLYVACTYSDHFGT